MYGRKKKFSTFSYKLVQISPIMILVNSGAFLSISSWFCELTELIFVMIPYISSTGYPPKRKGLWLCASSEFNQKFRFEFPEISIDEWYSISRNLQEGGKLCGRV